MMDDEKNINNNDFDASGSMFSADAELDDGLGDFASMFDEPNKTLEADESKAEDEITEKEKVEIEPESEIKSEPEPELKPELENISKIEPQTNTAIDGDEILKTIAQNESLKENITESEPVIEQKQEDFEIQESYIEEEIEEEIREENEEDLQKEIEKYQLAPTDEDGNKKVTVRPVKFQQFKPTPPIRAIKKNLDILHDISLHVSVELGRTKSTIREVIDFEKGSVIELNKIAGEQVEVYVNDKIVAKGEVIVIEDKFGVRITSTNIPKNPDELA